MFVYSFIHLFSFVGDIEQHRSRLLASMHDELPVSSVFTTAMELYRDGQQVIFQCRLNVHFHNENGSDFEGLTREFFTLFWFQCTQQHHSFIGRTERIPTFHNSPRSNISTWHLLGRILTHGFILTGYLPSGFCRSSLFFCITNTIPDNQLCMQPFINSIPDTDMHLINRALSYSGNNTFPDELMTRLLCFFSHRQAREIPSTANIYNAWLI